MHYTTQRFWKCYSTLPEAVQRVADQNYELLKSDPSHPSFFTPQKSWTILISTSWERL